MNDIKYLLILDFDETLANGHLYHKFNDNLEKFNSIWSTNTNKFQQTFFNDFDNMKQLFTLLVNNRFKICVASFGYQKMIDRFIELSYGYNLIEKNDIIGTDGFSKSGESNYNITKHRKNNIILHYIKKYNVLNKNVIFIDDDNVNIVTARNYFNPPITCINIKKGNLFPSTITNAITKLNDNKLSGNTQKKNQFIYVIIMLFIVVFCMSMYLTNGFFIYIF